MAKQKTKRKVLEGIATIQASFNNTIVTISNSSGDVLSQNSAGRCGFKGSRKSTPYAAKMAAEAAVKDAIDNYDMKRVVVEVSGLGSGRESAIRAINSSGLRVTRLIDQTPVPHNGCKPRKKRRV